MKTAKLSALILAVSVIVAAAAAYAQAPQPYGPPISLDQAKKAMTAAEAEARKNNWPVAIVIVDSGGNLVMMQRLDNTQFGSNEVARQKAHTAIAFKRPTKVFQDLIFKTSLVKIPIFVSEFNHDFIHWPLKESKVYEKWRAETEWGKLFAEYQRKGMICQEK